MKDLARVKFDDSLITRALGGFIQMTMSPHLVEGLNWPEDENTPSADENVPKFISDEEHQSLMSWRNTAKDMNLNVNHNEEIVSYETFRLTFGEASNNILINCGWVHSFRGEPIHRLLEKYRVDPAIDLGLKFGLPSLEASFCSELTEVHSKYDMKFRRQDTPGVYFTPSSRIYPFLPTYNLPVYLEPMYSIDHIFELSDAVTKTSGSLRDIIMTMNVE